MNWAETARKQQGLITRAQLLNAGLSENQIEWMSRTGKLSVRYVGVYTLPGATNSWKYRAQAALLCAGDSAALSHRVAARAHDLEGIPYGEGISVVVPYGRIMRPRDFEIFRSRTEIPTTLVDGLRVTSLPRTFVDLAAMVTERELEFALDHAVRRREGVDWLFTYLDELKPGGHKGIGVLRALAELRRDGAMDSALEVEVWRILREHHFPPFTKRFIVLDRGVYVMRCDFAWPEWKVVLHADSLRHHQTPAEMARDARQRAKLDELGWKQLSVVKPMLEESDWLHRLKYLLGVTLL